MVDNIVYLGDLLGLATKIPMYTHNIEQRTQAKLMVENLLTNLIPMNTQLIIIQSKITP